MTIKENIPARFFFKRKGQKCIVNIDFVEGVKPIDMPDSFKKRFRIGFKITEQDLDLFTWRFETEKTRDSVFNEIEKNLLIIK